MKWVNVKSRVYARAQVQDQKRVHGWGHVRARLHVKGLVL